MKRVSSIHETGQISRGRVSSIHKTGQGVLRAGLLRQVIDEVGMRWETFAGEEGALRRQ